MLTALNIHKSTISYQPADNLSHLIHLKKLKNSLVEVGLHVKGSPTLLQSDYMVSSYRDTQLYMNEEVAKEFLWFLEEQYKTVGMFMKLSEGRHPIDTLTHLFWKYCREYQKMTITVYDYFQAFKKMMEKGLRVGNENILLVDYMHEIEVHYETDLAQVHFNCDKMLLNKEGENEVEMTNERISLFLNEDNMKIATLTFLNPCLIIKTDS